MRRPQGNHQRQVVSLMITIRQEERHVKRIIFTELFAIRGIYTTAIDNPCRSSDRWGDSFGEVSPNLCLSLLRLRRGGYFSSTNSPNGLVRDDDLT